MSKTLSKSDRGHIQRREQLKSLTPMDKPRSPSILKRRWLFAIGVFVVAVIGITVATRRSSQAWVPTPIADLDMQCFREEKPQPWSFCINRPKTGSSQTVLYYLHGRNGDATWWNDDTYYTGDLYRLWRNRDVDAPVVVAVSFGPLWLATDSEKNPFTSAQTFLNEIIPTVESKLSFQVNERLLMGESMGGWNALSLGLKSNKQFSKVASLCPPLFTISPYAGLSDMWTYKQQNKEIAWHRAALLLSFSRKFFSSSDWASNNPVDLAQHVDADRAPSFYLSCGKKDQWGCMAGSIELVSRLQSRGVSIEWHPRPGGHCDIDTLSLAKFLVPEHSSEGSPSGTISGR